MLLRRTLTASRGGKFGAIIMSLTPHQRETMIKGKWGLRHIGHDKIVTLRKFEIHFLFIS